MKKVSNDVAKKKFESHRGDARKIKVYQTGGLTEIKLGTLTELFGATEMDKDRPKLALASYVKHDGGRCEVSTPNSFSSYNYNAKFTYAGRLEERELGRSINFAYHYDISIGYRYSYSMDDYSALEEYYQRGTDDESELEYVDIDSEGYARFKDLNGGIHREKVWTYINDLGEVILALDAPDGKFEISYIKVLGGYPNYKVKAITSK